MDRQQKLDFSRAEQLHLIQAARIPTTGQVRGATLKLVLMHLDHFGRGGQCWPSQATLAEHCGLGERTVRRAIEVLESMSLICVTRSRVVDGCRTTSNHYRIVWSELALLARDQSVSSVPSDAASAPAAEQLPCCDQPAIYDNQPAIYDNQPAIYDNQPATGGRITVLNRIEPPPTVQRPRLAVAGELRRDGPEGDAALTDLQHEAIRALGAAGVSAPNCRRLAIEHPPPAIAEVLDQYRTNRSVLVGPGAIVYRLDRGCWPVDGVRDRDSIERQSAAAVARRRRDVAYSIVTDGRRRRLDEGEITAALDSAGVTWEDA